MIFLHCIKQRVSYQYCVRTSTIRKQWMVRCIFYDQFNIYKICTIDIVDHNVASVVAHVWFNISRCRTYVPLSSTDSTPYVCKTLLFRNNSKLLLTNILICTDYGWFDKVNLSRPPREAPRPHGPPLPPQPPLTTPHGD